MTTRTHVVLVDDLSGEEIPDGQGGAVRFGLDGVEYTIDLLDRNAEKLRRVLGDFVAAGTRTSGRRRSRSGQLASPEHSAREIRDWARSNGYAVPDRGRIPTDVRAAFEGR